MELEARPKAHLKTFMRTVGSVLPLAGTEALRDATFEDSSEEEMPQARSPTAGSTALSAAACTSANDAGGGVGNGPFRPFDETERLDPMEGAQDEGGEIGVAGGGGSDSRIGKHTPTVGAAGGGGDGKEEAGGMVDVFAQACRAEAWAAVAIGVQFSGGREEEGKLYATRAADCLSGCLDAPLPEVRAVSLLCFWLLCHVVRRSVLRLSYRVVSAVVHT